MFSFLKKWYTPAAKVDYRQVLERGAQIVDVRTEKEYSRGHIRGSVNIPLGEPNVFERKINKNTPIITCCASGVRSARAAKILKMLGHPEVYEGGGWVQLNSLIKVNAPGS